MRHLNLLIIIKYSFIILFFSGCWHGTLILQGMFNFPDRLVVIPNKFPEGKVGYSYNFLTKVVEPTDSKVFNNNCSIKSGSLPPGINLETVKKSNSKIHSYFKLTGTPTKAGLYRFKVYCSCCMTMSGPAFHVENQFQIFIYDKNIEKKNNNLF